MNSLTTFRVAIRSAFLNIPSLNVAVSVHRRFSTTTAFMTLIYEAIKHDHREIENVHKKILGATNVSVKRQWQNQLTWELARHSIGEELVVCLSCHGKVSKVQ
jgi:hypothetical protein